MFVDSVQYRPHLQLCSSILLRTNSLWASSQGLCEPAAMAATTAMSSTPSGLVYIKCSSSASSTPSSVPAKLGYSRRLLLPALVGAPLLLQQHSASAKDIPLFGIRKRVEEAQKEVVQEVKELVKEGAELVKEGEKEISSVVAPAAAAVVATPNIDSPPPAYQAAAVAGAELVAVLVASSVVNGLVSES